MAYSVKTDIGDLLVADGFIDHGMAIQELAERVHALNRTWWHDPATDEPLDRNVGEMLMLAVTELSEAMEGHRKDLHDDHLPDQRAVAVELADALIRILDIAAGLHLTIGFAFAEKLAYNQARPDHKPAARLEPHGKRC